MAAFTRRTTNVDHCKWMKGLLCVMFVLGGLSLVIQIHGMSRSLALHNAGKPSMRRFNEGRKYGKEYYRSVNESAHRWEEHRKFRFPSAAERIKLYMSNWYLPPCDSIHDTVEYEEVAQDEPYYLVKGVPIENEVPMYVVVGKKVVVDHMFALEENEMSSCMTKPWGMRLFCSDVKSSIYHAGLFSDGAQSLPPVFVQFGDHAKCKVNGTNGSYVNSPSIPRLQKMRRSLPEQELDRVTSTLDETNCRNSNTIPTHVLGDKEIQPIVWILQSARHFKPLKYVDRFDRSWTEKLDSVVFRGTLTGHRLIDDTNSTDAEAICLSMPRCRIVLKNARSKIIDAKLVETLGIVPDNINGVNMMAPMMSQSEILAFKGCIVLEGNDVASGLKWMLLSQSVVLMPPPTFTSWAMEELLEPWVHYIPLKPDLSDVEEKVQWMLDNDAQAKYIARRGTLWMSDLVFHPRAAIDNMIIVEEIMQRYQLHFRVPK